MSRHYPQPRRGFTFIELMMGMVVIGLVLSALAVFVFGVADGWTNSESAQSVYLSGNMAVDRIDRALREASAISAPTTSDCMFWHDDNGDGIIQYSEISLLEFGGTSQTVKRYDVNPASAMASTIVASLPTWTAFKASGALLPSTPVGHNIVGCQFLPVTTAAGERISLEVILNVSDGKASTTIYTTATLRCTRGS